MKIVILGCGRVGAQLAALMSAEGHEVMIIDQNPDAFNRLGTDFQGETHTGDGTDEDVLRRAGLEQADAFAAVTNGDNRNIMAAQVAKHIFGVPKVICRIYDPIRQETYNALGLESISPTIVGAKLMRDALTNPAVRTTSPTQSLAEGRSVPLSQRPQERAGTR
ncbi:MAG TPA: TrkA family potassium uptake protein [Ktedonobacterales bacterium]